MPDTLPSQLWQLWQSPAIDRCLLGARLCAKLFLVKITAPTEYLCLRCKVYSLELGFQCFCSLMCQNYNISELILQRKLSLAFIALLYSSFTISLLNEHHCFSDCLNNFHWLLIPSSEHKIFKKEKKKKNLHSYTEKPVLRITAPIKFPIFITILVQQGWTYVVPFSVLVTILVITGNEPNCNVVGNLSLAIVWGPALTFIIPGGTIADQRRWSTLERSKHQDLSVCSGERWRCYLAA